MDRPTVSVDTRHQDNAYRIRASIMENVSKVRAYGRDPREISRLDALFEDKKVYQQLDSPSRPHNEETFVVSANYVPHIDYLLMHTDYIAKELVFATIPLAPDDFVTEQNYQSLRGSSTRKKIEGDASRAPLPTTTTTTTTKTTTTATTITTRRYRVCTCYNDAAPSLRRPWQWCTDASYVATGSNRIITFFLANL
ncbi:hypothetical protein V1478_016623 [Vespula squamosa]|uniref:Uncharacterized protein n=1 Tax=Vespula squamosa TaxID=30214 RepID=A0ABD2A0X5_VESSQ